jgi:hypothetical protein
MLIYSSRLEISISHVDTEGYGDGITSCIVRGGIRITQDTGSYLRLSVDFVQTEKRLRITSDCTHCSKV